MLTLRPSLDERDAFVKLNELFSGSIMAERFQSQMRRLQRRFEIYAHTCPVPFIAPGQIVTAEIRQQSELYLPIAEIRRLYNKFYSATLKYSPILSSTPFHGFLSWADLYAGLPPVFQLSANPAILLEKLLKDQQLRTKFLFFSFLPDRFYGGFERYPEQSGFVREWLSMQHWRPLRCLDAACGTGEDSYGLTRILLESGFDSEGTEVEGWTVEPLEVWAAAYCRFPHDRQREFVFREQTSGLIGKGCSSRITFQCADLIAPPPAESFDLILCNGLLGGPIINDPHCLDLVAGNLVRMLAKQGLLLVSDSFHQGWKRKCPQRMLRALFESQGLATFEAGEGFGVSKSVIRTL